MDDKDKKVKLDITISQSTREYIDYVKKEHNLRSLSQAVDYIVQQERKNDNVDVLADRILEKLKDKYENMFTRIRLGVNTADKNSQIMIEILNSMIYSLGVNQCYDTDIIKTDVVRDSENIIKNRIAHYKQIKDSKSK
jgi:hypothetical protein